MRIRDAIFSAALAGILIGCGGSDVAPPAPAAPADRTTTSSDRSSAEKPEAKPARKAKFRPVELESSSGGDRGESARARTGAADERQTQTIVGALQPFQILLGQWRWATRRKFGEFPKTGEGLEWVWDFRTDRSRPALVAHSEAYPYLHRSALTYLPEADRFQFTIDDEQGARRVLHGTWTMGGEPKEESDGRKLERTFKVELTQVDPSGGEQWQVTLNLLDNNQYLVDLKKRPPAGRQFGPLDTVRQQRVGTSFAVADSDNPGPKCIISGGLGSMSVSYKGKSYPVCCTGCAAAFNDDPERWLARLANDADRKKAGAE